MKLKQTQVSGLIGIVLGGSLLALQLVRTAGRPRPEEWMLPAVFLVLGIAYFLFGERITAKKGDRRDPPSG